MAPNLYLFFMLALIAFSGSPISYIHTLPFTFPITLIFKDLKIFKIL